MWGAMQAEEAGWAEGVLAEGFYILNTE